MIEQTVKDSRDLVLLSITLPRNFMDSPRLQMGEGGRGGGRSKIIRTIEGFFWVNSVKQLSAGDYFYCATYPGLVL